MNKIQDGSKYDLILMDIIMPNLDGVSACHLIRQFDRTPIIAMTSNIRSDDIQLYFHHGASPHFPSSPMEAVLVLISHRNGRCVAQTVYAQESSGHARETSGTSEDDSTGDRSSPANAGRDNGHPRVSRAIGQRRQLSGAIAGSVDE